jgi:hypothetical protein
MEMGLRIKCQHQFTESKFEFQRRSFEQHKCTVCGVTKLYVIYNNGPICRLDNVRSECRIIPTPQKISTTTPDPLAQHMLTNSGIIPKTNFIGKY